MGGRSIEAVLFDAAGTLFEPGEAVGASYARIARHHGVAISDWRLGDAFRRVLAQAPPRVFGGSDRSEAMEFERDWWRELVRQTFQAADSSARFEDFDAFFLGLFEFFGRGEAWRLAPGAASALLELRRSGLRTGVVSNFDHRLLKILQDLGIEDKLDSIVIPIDAAAAKPDAAVFAYALRRLGVPAEAAVHVGHDPERDLAAARRAGLRAIDSRELPDLGTLPARVAALTGPRRR